ACSTPRAAPAPSCRGWPSWSARAGGWRPSTSPPTIWRWWSAGWPR
ncbi:MAG: hypothetical protein AVDCRST_MAG40-1148, partial [uncultured Gemmatimonadaceae bacterium]